MQLIHIKKALLVLTWIAVLCPLQSFSQQETNDQLLKKQLGSYQIRFEELMGMRGMPWYAGKDIDKGKLMEFLKRYEHGNFLLLFYHFENDHLWSWLINRKGVIAQEKVATTAAELAQLELLLKQNIGVDARATNPGVAVVRGLEMNRGNASVIKADKIQQKLCGILIPKKIAAAIAADAGDSYTHLLVVPELNIASIPFYMLQPFGNSTYLVEKASVSMEYSLDELLNRIAYYREKYLPDGGEEITEYFDATFLPDEPLIVGNPDFGDCPFSQLSGAEEEARYTAQKLTAPLLSRVEATKRNVLGKIKGSELLYFATHAVASDEHPLDSSYLVLSGETMCEHWTAREIQSETFKKESIVILSACQTALGKAVDAGILGLSRAFIKGGSASVIMSMWSVNDNSTRELMHMFIDELYVPHNFFPADNFRAAILKYKSQNPSPNAWAAFTIMGTPYPISMKMQFVKK